MTPSQARLELPDGSSTLLSSSCTIGRASANQLVITHESVSRRHALIHLQGKNEHWLLDLGSSNGTTVNKRPVVQPVCLKHGDRITCGDVSMNFLKPATAPASMETLIGSTLVSVRVSRQWLLIADIEGFTPLSQQLSPGDLAHTVGAWFANTRSIVEDCGGDIHKYLGDGWLACWLDDTGANRRVARCLETLGKLQVTHNPPFRLALHLGEVTSSGSSASADLGMLGPDVNLLFRIEKIGAALGKKIIISEEAANALTGLRPCEPVGSHPLKGFDGEHHLFA